MKRNFDLFHARLKKIIGEESTNSFAKKCELSESLLRKYLSGESLPGIKALAAISKVSGVSYDWLVDGTGPMMKGEGSVSLAPVSESLPALLDSPPFTITNLEGRQVEYKPNPELCHIPVLSVTAACGKGSMVESEHVQAVFSALPSWFKRELKANPEDLNIIIAEGDSMTETIMPEEMVIVDRSRIYRRADGIWVFSYEDSVFLKRLQFLPGGKIVVKSDNPAYDTYTIALSGSQDDSSCDPPDGSFRLLGRVIAALPLRKL